MSAQGTFGTEETETNTERWAYPVTVPANSTVEATLSMGEAHINMPYEAKVEITTKDDNTLTFQLRGEYTGVTYTTPNFTIETIEH